jgi:hypothetical protein
MSQMLQLVEIGFFFSLRPTGITWEEPMEQCGTNIAQHGHLHISRIPNSESGAAVSALHSNKIQNTSLSTTTLS